MGSKYKFVPKEGPPPGLYEVDNPQTMTRVRSAVIRQDQYPKKPVGPTPDAGMYDKHLTPFGSGLKKVDMGSKYKFVPKEGPPPGIYTDGIEKAQAHTKPRTRVVHIDEHMNLYKRPAEKLPDPGQYDKHLTPFGEGLKKVDMGSKYKFVPKEGPPPGLYQDGVELAQALVKPKIPIVKIVEDSHPFRRPTH